MVGGLLIFLGIVFLVSAFFPIFFGVAWKVVLALLLVIFGVLLLLRRDEK